MKILGFSMIALLFVGLFVWIEKSDGWKVAIRVFLITSAVVGWIVLAVLLITKWG